MNSGTQIKSRTTSLIQATVLTNLKRVAPTPLVALALAVAPFSSSHAQHSEWIEVMLPPAQPPMQPVDSGAFPFPPPPLNFPDLPTVAGGTVDIEMVSLSLTSAGPMIVSPPDPTGRFTVDSFFDIEYQINATDSTGTSTFTVDSFFDIEYRMVVDPLPPVIQPDGSEVFEFDTEIVSMSLAGAHPIDLFGDPDFDFSMRLSPAPGHKHRGHVTILKIANPGGGGGGGTGEETYNVDSFFDVFTEISVDGGPFTPSVENSQVRLQSSYQITVPEPASLMLLSMGGILLARRRR